MNNKYTELIFKLRVNFCVYQNKMLFFFFCQHILALSTSIPLGKACHIFLIIRKTFVMI